MATQADTGQLSKEQFIQAMKYVLLRELVRLRHGEPAVAALDAYLHAGGTYDALPASLRGPVDELVTAASRNPPPGWNQGTMDWYQWACFCHHYLTLDPVQAKKLRDDLQSGKALDPVCSGHVGADPFYVGAPEKQHDNTFVEYLLIGAGIITAASAVVWIGSERGWFESFRGRS